MENFIKQLQEEKADCLRLIKDIEIKIQGHNEKLEDLYFMLGPDNSLEVFEAFNNTSDGHIKLMATLTNLKLTLTKCNKILKVLENEK